MQLRNLGAQRQRKPVKKKQCANWPSDFFLFRRILSRRLAVYFFPVVMQLRWKHKTKKMMVVSGMSGVHWIPNEAQRVSERDRAGDRYVGWASMDEHVLQYVLYPLYGTYKSCVSNCALAIWWRNFRRCSTSTSMTTTTSDVHTIVNCYSYEERRCCTPSTESFVSHFLCVYFCRNHQLVEQEQEDSCLHDEGLGGILCFYGNSVYHPDVRADMACLNSIFDGFFSCALCICIIALFRCVGLALRRLAIVNWCLHFVGIVRRLWHEWKLLNKSVFMVKMFVVNRCMRLCA